MAEFRPLPLEFLARRALLEFRREQKIFDLPAKKFWRGEPGFDDTVEFQGRLAGNPAGPASGPHGQLAQNIVLSWLAGGRVIEIKTVQANDRLTIPRPCIYMPNVGYNVEWSQELRIEQSLAEYVGGHVLIEILRGENVLDWQGQKEDPVQLDLSLGYSLEGIRLPPIRAFVESLKDARREIDRLRPQLPAKHRDHPFPEHVVTNVTLSTFHGCKPGEIEGIVTFLLGEMGLDVVVKMNPTLLGRDAVAAILHERLGYTEIEPNWVAFDRDLTWDAAVDLVRRLQGTAARLGRRFGVKFTNTLEVGNRGTPFAEPVTYLSGEPLHVIAVALVGKWREEFGASCPISFSAGATARNFAYLVAMGLVPVTTCTDLLRPGGYARLPKYLERLHAAMREAGVRTVRDFVGQARPLADIVRETQADPEYLADRNRKVPRRLDSRLSLFDCISCDKCIPVCPNDAIFVYEVPAEGAIQREHQIGIFADFCNLCGNCDTFCPEEGGPYRAKPNFFGAREGWEAAAPQDGFYVERDGGGLRMIGRIGGREHELWMVGDRAEPAEGAPYALMATLLRGVLDPRRVNYVNVRFVDGP